MKSLLSFLFILIVFFSFAQDEKKYVREGNEAYKNGKYKEAEKRYQKSVEKNNGSYRAAFNLGDAYYKQGKYTEAANQFEMLTNKTTNKDTLAKAYHNMGNALLKSKKFEESVDAYKKALKNNSKDEDARYNLSYAMKMLQQQQQQQKQDKDNKDNKDKKDDKKDKQDKDQQNQDKKDEQKNKEQQEQQAKNQISKEDAQRLLDALNNDEKNVQDKLKKKKSVGVRVQIEKDW